MPSRGFLGVGAAAALAALCACSGSEGRHDLYLNDNLPLAMAPKPTSRAFDFPNEARFDFVKDVGDRIFFGYGQSSLGDAAKEQLRKWVAHLNKYPKDKLLIEGHCDERGTSEYNLALGERRAAKARDFLVAQGISPDRLKIISYGKERPAILGTGEEAWAQNRRVVGVPQ